MRCSRVDLPRGDLEWTIIFVYRSGVCKIEEENVVGEWDLRWRVAVRHRASPSSNERGESYSPVVHDKQL